MQKASEIREAVFLQAKCTAIFKAPKTFSAIFSTFYEFTARNIIRNAIFQKFLGLYLPLNIVGEATLHLSRIHHNSKAIRVYPPKFMLSYDPG